MTTSAHYPNKFLSEAGFTLVELLVALVVALLGMSAIVVANLGQHQSYNTQVQIADARQKARAVIAVLRSDLLKAQPPSFTQTTPTSTSMTLTWENAATVPPTFTAVTYQWQANNGLLRGEGTGATTGAAITAATASQTIFVNDIDGIDFDYQPTTAAPKYVTISLVSRAGGADPHYSDNETYRTSSGIAWAQADQAGVTANKNLNNAPLLDNFHRYSWQETVFCRNQN